LNYEVQFRFNATSIAQIVVTDLDCNVEPLEISEGCRKLFGCPDYQAGCGGACQCGQSAGRTIDLSSGVHLMRLKSNTNGVLVDSIDSFCTQSYLNHTCFKYTASTVCFCWT
jgi:hypothetical protein